jgi:hypothetical protein
VGYARHGETAAVSLEAPLMLTASWLDSVAKHHRPAEKETGAIVTLQAAHDSAWKMPPRQYRTAFPQSPCNLTHYGRRLRIFHRAL